MKIDIHAGQQVAYKCGSSGWLTGNIYEGKAEITPTGLFIPIIPSNMNPEEQIDWAEINDIFFDTVQVEDWLKNYKEYFMTKEEYIQFIESEDFDKAHENAYVSDGNYIYYSVNKYTKNWIEKQPFDYIVREE